MLNKEECENALMNLCSSNSKVKDRKIFKQLIHEHFSNPPLKFEELEDGMWVWDNEYKAYRQIHKTYSTNTHDVVEFKSGQYPALARKYFFLENRFYRKEVKDDE